MKQISERLAIVPHEFEREYSASEIIKQSDSSVFTVYDPTPRAVIDCVHNLSQEVVEITNNKDIIGLEHTLEDSFCNVAVSSFITAYSRIHMDESIRKLRAADIDVIYTDTDSIVLYLQTWYHQMK